MRILLAEDERSLSRAVTALLERSKYSVDAVYDGEEALAYLETGNYDAVILDIMMPKVDGLTVLRRLRESGNLIPVLMLTAKSEVSDKVLGLDSGANDYLTKSFATAELMARIRAMTRGQSSQTDSRLTFGNITLDQATYELSSPFGSFRLANREFQMMEMLMRNPRQIIPSERLTGLTNDLIYLSRMEEEQPKLSLIEFPLSDVAEETAQSFLAPARTQGKTLSLAIEPMLSFYGEEKSIRQLLSILLDNALKYSPEGGEISLSVRKQNRSVVLTVSNPSVRPLEKGKQAQLFDRFYRGDPSRSGEGGYGLGLSIAAGIAAAHRGKIRAESPDGVCLVITAVIPA